MARRHQGLVPRQGSGIPQLQRPHRGEAAGEDGRDGTQDQEQDVAGDVLAWKPFASEVIGNPNFQVTVLYNGADVTADALDGSGYTISNLGAKKTSKIIRFKAKSLPGASKGLKIGSIEAQAPGGEFIDD
jgi:hypothetical protein